MDRNSKIIFFDIDDTLVNNTLFNQQALQFVLEILNIKEDKLSQEEKLITYLEIYEKNKTNKDKYIVYLQTLFSKYKEIFSSYEEALELGVAAKKRYEKYRDEAYITYMPKHTVDVLKKLKEDGFELGIISQGDTKYQKRKFDLLKIIKYINPELIYYTTEKTEEFYKSIKSNLNDKYKCTDFTMVGDRVEKDIILAKKAGFKTIRILGKGRYASYKPKKFLPMFENFTKYYESLNN